MKVLKEVFIPAVKTLKILEEKAKSKELNYVQKNTYDILKKFVKIDEKKAEELKAELSKIEKLREKHIILLIDFLPQDKDELKTVLYKDYNMLKEEEKNQILELLKK